MLIKWRNQCLDLDDILVSTRRNAPDFPDPADHATQEEEFSLELRTRDRERKLIKKIDESIDMLDNNDYGYCETCGVEIGIRRLEARPTATQCIDCKSLDEIKEKKKALKKYAICLKELQLKHKIYGA